MALSDDLVGDVRLALFRVLRLWHHYDTTMRRGSIQVKPFAPTGTATTATAGCGGRTSSMARGLSSLSGGAAHRAIVEARTRQLLREHVSRVRRQNEVMKTSSAFSSARSRGVTHTGTDSPARSFGRDR